MESKELGRTGQRVPEIGIGTWKLSAEQEMEVRSIRKGISLGMRFVDTAEMYGSEAVVGRAIKGSKVFVATKVSPQNLHYYDVIRSCNASLKRLGVKQIGLYQVHWPNPGIPIKETMGAMEHLVEEGKIRHIGVSNFSASQIDAAQNALKTERIVSNQVEYSMLVREIEQELTGYCKKEKITIIAYSPFGTGRLFKGKYGKLHDVLEVLAEKYSKTVSQIALNWVISKPNVVAIPKASSIAHMADNAGASGWQVSKKDSEDLENLLQEFSERSLANGPARKLLKSPSFWKIYGGLNNRN